MIRTRLQGDTPFFPNMLNNGKVEVCLKEDVDKVIAELKQKINEAQTELELWRDGSIISEAHQKELDEKRHSNYKRCLAMASTCRLRARWFGDNAFYKKERWALKWHRFWLKIAESFKEAS